MGFGVLEQLIAKGRPSPITSALSGFQTGAGIMPGLQKQRLANQLLQAQIAKAQRPDIQGTFAQNIAGLMQIAKQRGLTPAQTSQLLDQFQLSQQKKGISLGFGQGGGLTSLQIGGTAAPGGVAGAGIPGAGGVLTPTAVIPNTGQTSRGTAGATKINPVTGEVTSIPTRRTGGFLQAGVVGNEKYQDGLRRYQKGMSPYIGENGSIKYGLDTMLSKMPDAALSIYPGAKQASKEATERLGNYDAAKGSVIGIATDAARMSAGGTPGEKEIQKWSKSINPNYWGGSLDRFNLHIKGLSKLGNSWVKFSKQGLKGGIPVSQLSPEEQTAVRNAQQAQTARSSLGKIFFPDEEHIAHLHAMMQPQHLVNGVPHLKPSQTANMNRVAQAAQPAAGKVRVQSPDGRTGTIPAANLEAAIKAGYKRVS